MVGGCLEIEVAEAAFAEQVVVGEEVTGVDAAHFALCQRGAFGLQRGFPRMEFAVGLDDGTELAGFAFGQEF